VRESAEQVYQQLQGAGYAVLFDDREEGSAGVKFNDADLLGMPVRVTVSPRSIENGGAGAKGRAGGAAWRRRVKQLLASSSRILYSK
jgi:prolyl-tRNA synthetase